jgi:hypothetical protein
MTNKNPRRGNTAGAEVVDQFEQQQHTTPPTSIQSHDTIAAQRSATNQSTAAHAPQHLLNDVAARAAGPQACDHALSVYDGALRVGSITERDGKLLTYDIDDLHLGVFAALRDAMRSLPPARSSS